MPSTLSIIRDLFPDRCDRSKAIAVWAATASSGAAAGPVVGGALIDRFWWGAVFVINVPVVAVLLMGAVRFVPESKDPDPDDFDLAGAVLFMAPVLSVVYAIKDAATHGVGTEMRVALDRGIRLPHRAGGALQHPRDRRLPHGHHRVGERGASPPREAVAASGVRGCEGRRGTATSTTSTAAASGRTTCARPSPRHDRGRSPKGPSAVVRG